MLDKTSMFGVTSTLKGGEQRHHQVRKLRLFLPAVNSVGGGIYHPPPSIALFTRVARLTIDSMSATAPCVCVLPLLFFRLSLKTHVFIAAAAIVASPEFGPSAVILATIGHVSLIVSAFRKSYFAEFSPLALSGQLGRKMYP